MERCKNESLGQQQQHQQQTAVEEQRCPFLSPTTPAWGDRNVSEQSIEETNNNLSFSSIHLFPSTSDSKLSMSNSLSSSRNSSSSSIRSLTENTNNIQSSIDVSQLPRKCKLCSYVATERNEYIDHIIAHCTFTKGLSAENEINLNGYVDDEDLDDSGNESQVKGKKRPKIPKPKICSKCEFVARTKLVLWLHLRQHFMQEECSGFVCVLCPFATTLKHHMTFHWFSAHDDFKGFTCRECQYTCVSKSMLTSHMKTHSEVYQYNCGSCSYRTKFCNAMKKHLKDSLHVAGTVLNPDGTPNPFATIDVYGSKRGPRRRPFVEGRKEAAETIEDRPSTSRTTPTISTVPTSSTSVISSSISSSAISASPDSKVTLISPIRTSPTKISPVRTSSTPIPSSRSNPAITDVLATFNVMDEENGDNLSINPNEIQISSALSNPILSTLCHLLVSDMGTRRDVNDEEHMRVFRLLRSVQRFLLSPGYIEHEANANGELSDNVKVFDEPSTSTSINELSTSTAVDEPSTSAAVDELSTFKMQSRSRIEENRVPDEPLDLSMSAMSKVENQPRFQEPVASSTSRRSKRKRKATKLEYLTIDENTNDNETQTRDTNKLCTEFFFPALLRASQSDLQRRNEQSNVAHNANIYKSSFICYYCHIIFANEIMYAVHMSFHNAKNPLMCALCDRKSANITAFFLHLVRTKH